MMKKNKLRYIAFYQGTNSIRSHYVPKKNTFLKGILLTGETIEISLSVNSRTEVFLAGEEGKRRLSAAPDKRVIQFNEKLNHTIYGVIERTRVGNNRRASVYLLIEETA